MIIRNIAYILIFFWSVKILIIKSEDTLEANNEDNAPVSSLNSLLFNTEYCTEELSKLLDFNSIISSSCGVDSLKKIGGWLNKHKNSLPLWPKVSIAPPRNLITFYVCDWGICEREVENQIDQKIKFLYLPVKQVGTTVQKEIKNQANIKEAIDIQLKNGNLSIAELINAFGIWWCQKALPQLITDKETAFQSLFKEFSLPSVDTEAENNENLESLNTTYSSNEQNSVSETKTEEAEISVILPKTTFESRRNLAAYPTKLVFLKNALSPPMECYIFNEEKSINTTIEELREILDSERHRLESNLAFVIQMGALIWRTNKTFSPLGKNTASIQNLIGTTRVYTEEVRRSLFKLYSILQSSSNEEDIEDLKVLIVEICRIQSITDAISLVVIKLLRKSKFSKKTSEDAEHLLMNWMFEDMHLSKSLISTTKPVVTKKSSPSYIDRARRMRNNAKKVLEYINRLF